MKEMTFESRSEGSNGTEQKEKCKCVANNGARG